MTRRLRPKGPLNLFQAGPACISAIHPPRRLLEFESLDRQKQFGTEPKKDYHRVYYVTHIWDGI